MGSLALIHQLRGHGLDRTIDNAGTEKSGGRYVDLRHILDWIALCFVREVQDVVAVAIATQHQAVTLYIANNRGGPPGEEDIVTASTFLSTIRHGYASNVDKKVMAERLVQMLFLVTPTRLQHKLFNIMAIKLPKSQAVDASTLQGWLDLLVSRWATRGGQETSVPITEYAADIFSDRARTLDALKHCFRFIMKNINGLLEMMSSDYVVEKVAGKFQTMVIYAMILLQSSFFRSLFDHTSGLHPPALSDEYGFLLKLWRRLYRVTRYEMGARLFVSAGMPLFRDVLGQDGMAKFLRGDGGLDIQWIGAGFSMLPNHARPYIWPETPKARLIQLLKSRGFLERMDMAKLDEFLNSPNVGRAWSNGAQIRPQYHCEVQLVNYLRHTSTEVNGKIIGVSKPICMACDLYLKQLSGEGWVVSGTSGKAHASWMIPPDTAGMAVALEIDRELNEVLTAVARKHAKHRSGGLDSSSGSHDDEFDFTEERRELNDEAEA